jgi:hypothetical protein
MGLIVMSLNEYIMDQSLLAMNQKIKHVTVLEEAHNLLKNTGGSSSGSEEGGNMAAKSVEMIANSIAEMRTYGEGFIIVDQSPSAIDISAIRNTNTKIIMRLPEDADRKQAGKSAALKDNQIDELAKLHRGVAVVYQNNWLDPVLCAICKANVKEEAYKYNGGYKASVVDHTDLLKMLMKNRVDEKLDFDLDRIERDIEETIFSTQTKLILREIIEKQRNGIDAMIIKENGFKRLAELVCEILDCEKKFAKYDEFGDDCVQLQDEMYRDIRRCTDGMSKETELAVSQCIVRTMVDLNNNRVDLYSSWREFAVKQRKLV